MIELMEGKDMKLIMEIAEKVRELNERTKKHTKDIQELRRMLRVKLAD